MIVHAAATTPKAANNPALAKVQAKVQQLQAQRMDRMKHLGRAIVRKLKHVDAEARELVVQDIQDLTVIATELIQQQPATVDNDDQ